MADLKSRFSPPADGKLGFTEAQAEALSKAEGLLRAEMITVSKLFQGADLSIIERAQEIIDGAFKTQLRDNALIGDELKAIATEEHQSNPASGTVNVMLRKDM